MENILSVSVSGDSGTVMARWETPNTAKGKARLAGRIAALGKARCIYEAGPCGFDLRRFLDEKRIPCGAIEDLARRAHAHRDDDPLRVE